MTTPIRLLFLCLTATAHAFSVGHHPLGIVSRRVAHLAASTTTTTTTTTAAASTTTTATDATKTVVFSKYHGLGNDFILIDDRHRPDPSLTPAQAAQLCHRNFGVGADGVIFALKSTDDTNYDFKMRIYNSDGSEPEMCGNGIRCLAQFLADLGESQESYRIDTLAGPIVPVRNNDATQMITVDMGEPVLQASLVPTTLTPNAQDDSVVEQVYQDKNGKEWKITCVSMGNPHAIIFVNDLETDIDFNVDGPKLEAAVDIFPAKANIEFVQVLSDTHLLMKVWERGAGPTLACGTGACALTVAAMRAGKIPRTNNTPVKVTLPGGDLLIEWRESNNRIYMTGPATFSFAGQAKL